MIVKGVICLSFIEYNWSEINGTYLKYTTRKVLTCVYIYETITIIKVMNIPIIPKGFLVPLCGGGASLDKISFGEKLSEKVIFEFDDKKPPKKREFQAGKWDTHTVVLRHKWTYYVSGAERILLWLQCTVWGGKWQNCVGPCKPEWEFRFYSKHRESLEGTM